LSMAFAQIINKNGPNKNKEIADRIKTAMRAALAFADSQIVKNSLKRKIVDELNKYSKEIGPPIVVEGMSLDEIIKKSLSEAAQEANESIGAIGAQTGKKLEKVNEEQEFAAWEVLKKM